MSFIAALLMRIPFLGTAATFLKGNLVYLRILAVVMLALFIAWAVYGKHKAEAALQQATTSFEQRLTVLEGVNQAHMATITNLEQLREKDAQALQGLMNDFRELTAKDALIRRRFKELEASDEEVRAYLNRPVPRQLACVLDGTCPNGYESRNANRKSQATRGAGKSLPGPSLP